MSYEFPPFRDEVTEEKKEPPQRRMTGSRASRAILLATALGFAAQTADAKKSKRQTVEHRDESAQQDIHPERSAHANADILVTGVTLDSKEDHGLDTEVQVSELLKLKSYENEKALKEALKSGELIDIRPKKDDGYEIDVTLGERALESNRHLYAALTPHTAEVLRTVAEDFFQTFHRKLVVTSAVRTKKYVDSLRKVNKNVASGYTSTHLHGTTFDIGYRLMQGDRREHEFILTKAEGVWLKERLLALEASAEIQATKETQQPCIHVMVFPEMDEEQRQKVAGIMNAKKGGKSDWK